MASGKGSDFIRRLNEQNEKIAARQASEEAEPSVGLDPIRVQRDAERRAKWGRLRARPAGLRDGKGAMPD